MARHVGAPERNLGTVTSGGAAVSAAAGGSLLASLAQMLPPPWSTAGCIMAPAVSSGLMWTWPRLRRWHERRQIQAAIDRYQALLRQGDNGLTDETREEIVICIQRARIELVREDLLSGGADATSVIPARSANHATSLTLPLPAALPSGITVINAVQEDEAEGASVSRAKN